MSNDEITTVPIERRPPKHRPDADRRAAVLRRRNNSDHECIVCGQGMVISPNTLWVECIKGGLDAVRSEDRDRVDRDAADYMGCFPVGPACASRLAAEVLFSDGHTEYGATEAGA